MAEKAQWYRVESNDAPNIDMTIRPRHTDVRFCRGAGESTTFVGRGVRVLALDKAPYLQRDLKSTAVGYNGGLYVSKDVLAIIVGSGQVRYFASTRIITVGRRQFHKLDETTIGKLIDHNSYPRRNDNEIKVQTRNDDLIDWLLNFI